MHGSAHEVRIFLSVYGLMPYFLSLPYEASHKTFSSVATISPHDHLFPSGPDCSHCFNQVRSEAARMRTERPIYTFGNVPEDISILTFVQPIFSILATCEPLRATPVAALP